MASLDQRIAESLANSSEPDDPETIKRALAAPTTNNMDDATLTSLNKTTIVAVPVEIGGSEGSAVVETLKSNWISPTASSSATTQTIEKRADTLASLITASSTPATNSDPLPATSASTVVPPPVTFSRHRRGQRRTATPAAAVVATPVATPPPSSAALATTSGFISNPSLAIPVMDKEALKQFTFLSLYLLEDDAVAGDDNADTPILNCELSLLYGPSLTPNQQTSLTIWRPSVASSVLTSMSFVDNEGHPVTNYVEANLPLSSSFRRVPIVFSVTTDDWQNTAFCFKIQEEEAITHWFYLLFDQAGALALVLQISSTGTGQNGDEKPWGSIVKTGDDELPERWRSTFSTTSALSLNHPPNFSRSRPPQGRRVSRVTNAPDKFFSHTHANWFTKWFNKFTNRGAEALGLGGPPITVNGLSGLKRAAMAKQIPEEAIAIFEAAADYYNSGSARSAGNGAIGSTIKYFEIRAVDSIFGGYDKKNLNALLHGDEAMTYQILDIMIPVTSPLDIKGTVGKGITITVTDVESKVFPNVDAKFRLSQDSLDEPVSERAGELVWKGIAFIAPDVALLVTIQQKQFNPLLTEVALVKLLAPKKQKEEEAEGAAKEEEGEAAADE